MVMGYLAEEVEAEPPLARAVKPNDLPADWAPVVPMNHHVPANIMDREDSPAVVPVEVELQPEFPAQGQAVMDGHITPVLEDGVFDTRQDFRNSLTVQGIFSIPEAFLQRVLLVKIRFTGAFVNDQITRCLVLLQDIGTFASTAPTCDVCNRPYLQGLKQEKRKGINKGYIWNGPRARWTREGAKIRCVCANGKSIAAGTNMHGL